MSQPEYRTTTTSPYAGSDAPLNVVSIVGFVLSLFGLSLIAVILGHIGLSQTKRRGERGRGFAIAALIIGYLSLLVEIGIVVLILIAAGIAAANGTITTS